MSFACVLRRRQHRTRQSARGYFVPVWLYVLAREERAEIGVEITTSTLTFLSCAALLYATLLRTKTETNGLEKESSGFLTHAWEAGC